MFRIMHMQSRHDLLLQFVRTGLAFLCVALLGACQPPNHYLIHPEQAPPSVVSWNEEIHQGQLLIRLHWARPEGAGRFPAVLVHPEAGKQAAEMQGVVWDLARQGYVAVAADYRRLIDGEYRGNLFVWRADTDVTTALEYVLRNPAVDGTRVATLGFSQGGVYSLLIAEHAPSEVKAVIAYYPVTDFEYWLDPTHYSNPMRRQVYRIIRWYFKKESQATSEEEFRQMLRRASPLPQAEDMQAPVLLIHGENDTSASVEESQRLADRLQALGRTVKLLVFPGQGHVFNFKQPEPGREAWVATLDWLRHYLAVPEPTAVADRP